MREGGTGVLIVQHPLALDPIHFLNNRLAGRDGASYFDLADRRRNAPLPRNSALIVYSQYTDRTQMNWYPKATQFCDKWAEVIRILLERHKGDARVAVYPYGGMQHQGDRTRRLAAARKKVNRRRHPACNDEAMDLTKMLTELRAERESIEQAILVLERLARGGTRRGRPPEWMRRLEAAEAKPEKRRGRPPGTKNKPKTEPE